MSHFTEIRRVGHPPEGIAYHICHTHLTKRITPIKEDITIPVMKVVRITQAPFEPPSVRILITN
jgi:hypothetical protein